MKAKIERGIVIDVPRIRPSQQQEPDNMFFLVLIALHLSDLSTPAKVVERLQAHVEALTGNVNFPTTTPTVAELQAKADDIIQVRAQINTGNSGLITYKNQLVREAKEMIRQLSYDIQFQSHGDDILIESAGFQVRREPTPLPLPEMVGNLRTYIQGPGAVRLRWDSANFALNYLIQRSTDITNPDAWVQIGKTRRVTFVADGLTPGVVYYFRVISSNGTQDGNPSDPAEQRSQ